MYPPRASYCRKLFVSLISKLFLWTERAKVFLPLPAWPDLKASRQNLNRHTSVQVCLDQRNTILCQSEIWTLAGTIPLLSQVWRGCGDWWCFYVNTNLARGPGTVNAATVYFICQKMTKVPEKKTCLQRLWIIPSLLMDVIFSSRTKLPCKVTSVEEEAIF